MPIPVVAAVAVAATCAAAGIGSTVHGGVKLKSTHDTMKEAKKIQDLAVARFEKKNRNATMWLDEIGIHEIRALSSLNRFDYVMDRIQDKPEYKEFEKGDFSLPEYTYEEIKNISTNAALLLNSIGGASAGTAAGFLAAGATQSLVMAFGTASTGTAIAELSGAAATNATLAWLGGGSLAAGGGGVAVGSAVLGGMTAGVGILIGGVVFNVTGCTLSKKSKKALEQAKEIDRNSILACDFLTELCACGRKFNSTLLRVHRLYLDHVKMMEHMLLDEQKTSWSMLTDQDKRIIENTCLLVGMIYKMCNTQFVKETGKEVNEIKHDELDSIIKDADNLAEYVKVA